MGRIEAQTPIEQGQGSEFDLLMKKIWEQPYVNPESQLRRNILTEMDARTRTQIDIPYLLIPYGSTLHGYAERTSDMNSAIALPLGATIEDYSIVANSLYSNFRTLYDEQHFYAMRWDNHVALQAFHLITDRTNFKNRFTQEKYPMDDAACYTLLQRCGGFAFLPAIGEFDNPEHAQFATQLRKEYFDNLGNFIGGLNLDPQTFWDDTMRRMLTYTGIYPGADQPEEYNPKYDRKIQNTMAMISTLAAALPEQEREEYIEQKMNAALTRDESLHLPMYEDMKQILNGD